VSEADLVRARRNGSADPEADMDGLPAEAAAAPRVLHDPALSRAVDLLRGLALLRRD
jgi:hypothetical protein